MSSNKIDVYGISRRTRNRARKEALRREKVALNRNRNRRGRPPTTRANRNLIRENATNIELEDIRQGNTIRDSILETGSLQISDTTPQLISERRQNFVNRIGINTDISNPTPSDNEYRSSTFVTSIARELYQAELDTQEVAQNVQVVTEASNRALNSSLIIASSTISALGGALDVVNQLYLSAIFLGVSVIRTAHAAISAGTLGIGAAVTIGLSVAAITTLTIQAVKVRQNRTRTAEQLGLASASLTGLAGIGSAL